MVTGTLASLANSPALRIRGRTYCFGAPIVPTSWPYRSTGGGEEGTVGSAAMRSVRFPPGLKSGIWGAVIGAVAISVLGFSTFGWTLGGTAERMAKERAQAAVVDALAPMCVARFRQQADAPAKMTEFNKASSWDRRSIIEKGGWATIPGTNTPNSDVATACAERLARSL